MKTTILIFLSLTFLQACGQQAQQDTTRNNQELSQETKIINPAGQTLQSRIRPPEGFQRTKSTESSFADYLRKLPLKPDGSEVMYYNGRLKPNLNIYEAVVALGIGTKDLHQCADAVMRLRAEYLWNQKQYDKIHFNFTNGFRVDYAEWMKGKRIAVKGNSTSWKQSVNPSNTYNDFWNYMETIFSYAGTLSLSKELKPVSIADLTIGDVFIQGGSPGHAVMVVDVAVNTQTNKKIFLLAQSYMPAQEIQILKNPSEEKISPWYSAEFGAELITPEWTFTESDLKRFNE